MAVVKVAKATRLTIKVQTGTSASGSAVYRTRSYSNVKPAALEADIFAVGQALANLQKYPLSGIARIDEGELVNQ